MSVLRQVPRCLPLRPCLLEQRRRLTEDAKNRIERARIAATPKARRAASPLLTVGEGEIPWTRPPRRRPIKKRGLIERKKELLEQHRELLRSTKPDKLDDYVERTEGAGETSADEMGKPTDWFNRNRERRRRVLPEMWSPTLAMMPGDPNEAGSAFPVITVRRGKHILHGRSPLVPLSCIRESYRCGHKELIPPGSLVSLPPSTKQKAAEMGLLGPGMLESAVADADAEGAAVAEEEELDGSAVIPANSGPGDAPAASAHDAVEGAEKPSAGARALATPGKRRTPYLNGLICEVQAVGGRVLGWGVWTSSYALPHKGRICLRIFEWGPYVGQRDKPREDSPVAEPAGLAPGRFGDEFWLQRISLAYRLRADLIASERTTAYRLLNDMGDGIPGLVCDVYGNLASVIVFDPPRAALRALVAFLESIGIEHVHVRDRIGRNFLVPAGEEHWPKGVEPPAGGWLRLHRHTMWVRGRVASSVFSESGIKHLWRPMFVTNTNTGFYLEHRAARTTLMAMAKDKSVLDLMCGTGAFGLAALHGGASRVVFVERSEHKVNVLRENLDMMFPEGHSQWSTFCRLETVDVNNFLRSVRKQADRTYDIVVLDPRSIFHGCPDDYTPTESEMNYYRELVYNGMRGLRRPGLFFVFLNVPHLSMTDLCGMLAGSAARQYLNCRIVRKLTPSVDFVEDPHHKSASDYKGLLVELR